MNKWLPVSSANTALDAYPLDHRSIRQSRTICGRIAKDSPNAALDIGRNLFDGIARLTAFPHRGRAGLRQGTRELVFTPLPYIVVYRVTGQTIETLHIWHGAQHRPT